MLGSYETGGEKLELLVEATRTEFSVFAWFPKPEVGATRSIDLGAIGGRREPAGKSVSFMLDESERDKLLTKLSADAPVAISVTDAAGATQTIRLVEPQDVVDLAMFRGCVGALAP